MSDQPVEISWFGALCDDDYEYLGVPEDRLKSSWPHCSEIVKTADALGYDNVLLPSGYQLGMDSTSFAAAIATHTCLLYTSPSPRDRQKSRMPSSA